MREASRYAEQRLYRFLPYAVSAIALAFILAIIKSHV